MRTLLKLVPENVITGGGTGKALGEARVTFREQLIYKD